jgi:ABC-type branched-subunit amino acid transport system permease subunit
VFLYFAAPLLILVLVPAVPLAYRYLWPITIKRPRLFLVITLAMGLVIAGVAIYWIFSVPTGTGISGASPQTAAASAAVESVLQNRLLVAAVFAVLLEYLLCRITQTIMGM